MYRRHYNTQGVLTYQRGTVAIRWQRVPQVLQEEKVKEYVAGGQDHTA
jgi:hypothetical protein